MDPSNSVEQTNYLNPPLYGIGKRGWSIGTLEQPRLLVLVDLYFTKLGWSSGAVKQIQKACS